MSDELRALLELLLKVGVNIILKLLIAAEVNPIPEFGLPMMQVIN